MSHDTINTARAQADVHRDGLADALTSLFNSRLPTELGRATTGQVADTTRAAVTQGLKSVKSNPLSVVLIGAGLAMLAMPSRPRTSAPQPSPSKPLTGEFDARVAKAAAKHQQEARINANRVDVGPGRAQALRLKLDQGLDKLGPKARARVRAARLSAISAQETLEKRAAQLSERVQTAHQTQPLTTLVAALGIGAILGALLPCTRRETELLVAKRDQLFRDAEALLRREVTKLEERGRNAVDAGMTAVRDELDHKTGANAQTPDLHG